ncbi:class II aldolase/adducin family protein [Amorphus coralli]|uniref:class II aldolase/adducin family protein n=1 Tax=Amorphus coralli TaxID=340680 RepID=UPI00036F4719|nr:class II aldolase/adducin family protein [Amorphus coralli]
MELADELVLASHILAHNDVLDVFGHVSVRDPDQPDRFLLSRSRSPGMVTRDDVIAFGMDAEPVEPDGRRLFLERVIHAAIYSVRPDIQAISHFHAEAIMPFCVSGVPVRAVTHVGATAGAELPFWSAQEAFGDTSLLVANREQADSLAVALGTAPAVLLRNHGGVAAGASLKEMVFRSVHLCLNARAQWQASLIGSPTFLTEGEVERAAAANLGPLVLERAWDYWRHRLEA